MIQKLKGRDFLAVGDFTPKELAFLLTTATGLKKKGNSRELKDKTIALLFEKPSLRTRVSFDVAMHGLGGHSVYLSQAEVGLNKRESTGDIAHTLERYVDGIVLRTFAQKTLMDIAEHASVPVINALSDEEHPCQALGDLLTIREHKGKIKGIRIAFIGDGHNVASSLAMGSVMCGADFVIASPRAHRLPQNAMARIEKCAAKSGGSFQMVESPKEAVKNADIVYTDVWTSMGQEKSKARTKSFAGFAVTAQLMALAKRDAIFMHALPAHRGEEVTDEVIDGGQSVVFDQAENRLHAQKAVLLLLIGPSLRKASSKKK
ncbi:MAG: ornithine carbamoyltransferase [bacterium]|nr:ornithine carbamoyltransferase [bacterium]